MSAVPTSYYQIDPARLKAARRAAVLTQAKLAEKSGVSYDTIRRIEGNQRSHRYPLGHQSATVRALAESLAVSPVDILCRDFPQGKTPGYLPGRPQGKPPGKSPGNSPTLADLKPDLGLALDVEPQTLNAEGKEPLPPTAAVTTNGKGPKRFYLADVVNLQLVVSLKDRYRRRAAWNAVTPGLLTALVLGSEERHIPACGAQAVNLAIEDLYENAANVPAPAGYLLERAQAHSSSNPSLRGVK